MVIAGFRCTRLNADGTVRWTVLPPIRPGESDSIFCTAAVGASDGVLAGGEFISPAGEAIQAGWPGQHNRTVGYIPGQGFLSIVGESVWCIDDQGMERWHVWLDHAALIFPRGEAGTSAFAVSPSGDGWFVLAQDGLYTGGHLFVWRFENDGRLRWRQRVSDLASDRLLLSATSDGKLVAAVGQYDFQGTYLPAEVFSFTIEENPAAPRVTRSPSAPDWDGIAPLTLSVEATGEALTYQWRRLGQVCAGETNSTITLRPSLSEPATPGSYWCEVSNPHGTAASRMASVKLAQPRMIVSLVTNDYFGNPSPSVTASLTFESAEEIDRPYEVSTNLVGWTLGPSLTNCFKRYDGHYESGLVLPISGSNREFYRLKAN